MIEHVGTDDMRSVTEEHLLKWRDKLQESGLRVRLETHAARASLRIRRMTAAAYMKAVADFSVPTKSVARRRFRLIQAKNRSTTQRRGSTVSPTWLGSLLTISTTIRVALATRSPL